MNVGQVTSSAAGTEQVAEEVNLAVIASGIASERARVNLRIYPCREISDNPFRGDFNTLAEYKKAHSYWLGQVKAWEREYGSR